MAARDEARTESDNLAVQIGESFLRGAGLDGVFACDRQGVILSCDADAAAFLKVGRRRVVGLVLMDLLAALEDQTLELRFLSALRSDDAVEFVVARPGGDDTWMEVRGLPIASGMAFLMTDVTDRERSERNLRRNEHRLRAANDSLRLAHKAARAATWEWRTGQSMRWLDVPAARALIDLAPNATEGEAPADWRTFVVPEDMEAVEAALRELPGAGQASFEYRVTLADGSQRWLRSSAAVVERWADGRPARVVGVTLDVTPQKQVEARLQREVLERRRAEQRQQMLIHELNHRVKNMLATVQSVARQSLGSASLGGPLADFEDRLMALAWTHDILTREHWAGASLKTVLARTMAPHGDGRVTLSGPDLRVSPKMALALAMGVHELATNAVKYGALSADAGRVDITWRISSKGETERLVLDWRERGGPRVAPPKARGFGSRLLERGLARELGGEVKIRFDPAGVTCRVDAPFEPEAAPAPDLDHAPEREPPEVTDAPTAH